MASCNDSTARRLATLRYAALAELRAKIQTADRHLPAYSGVSWGKTNASISQMAEHNEWDGDCEGQEETCLPGFATPNVCVSTRELEDMGVVVSEMSRD